VTSSCGPASGLKKTESKENAARIWIDAGGKVEGTLL
jgi:hypothetical protein